MGEIVAYFEDPNNITPEELGEYMLGIKKQKASEIKEVAK